MTATMTGGETVAAVKDHWRRSRAELERLETLGERLRQQAGDLAAAEYRWLRDLEEFDRGGGWCHQGARTCAGWLSWACGLSPPAARERLRVARALSDLPLVCAEFAAGRLTYSKVRAITRVATPENEESLVTFGLDATASQLEEIVRRHRRAESAEEAQEGFERRWLRWRVDADGMGRLSARLPAAELALITAAIESLVDNLGEEQPPPRADAAAACGRDTVAVAEAGAPDAPVRLPPYEVEPLEARRAEALRVMAETVLANGPTPAAGPDRHRVVVCIRAQAHPADNPSATSPAVADDSAPRAPADPAPSLHLRLEGVEGELGDGTPLADETWRRLACDSEVITLIEDALGRPLGVGRQSRRISARLRRALQQRDRGCRFPTCTANRFVDAHHVRFWSDGGPTELENLVLLCRFHHRLVHEAGYSVRDRGEQTFTFHRPDGTLLPAAAPAPGGDADRPARDNTAAGLTVTPDTTVPTWDGTRPDYDTCMAYLHYATHGWPAPAPWSPTPNQSGPADLN